MNVAHLNEQQAGQPARTVGRFVPHEIIGPPGCPIMYRWTLLKFGRAAVHRWTHVIAIITATR